MSSFAERLFVSLLCRVGKGKPTRIGVAENNMHCASGPACAQACVHSGMDVHAYTQTCTMWTCAYMQLFAWCRINVQQRHLG